MTRVFSSLAVAQLILFAATAAMGVFGSDQHGSRHILLAVLALFLSCLTQVVLFTYFTVTGKMVVQAVHLGQLDQTLIAMVKSLKRSVTHCLALAFLSIVAVVIAGAIHLRTGGSSAIHLLVSGTAVAVHCFVFYRELGLILKNAGLVAGTLQAYERQREARSSRDELNHCATSAAAISTS